MQQEQYSCIIDSEHYQNPIVFGDYPDPSILKDGEDYYLVHSICSEHSRLMPMWHSNDLIHWELLYHVFNESYHSGKNTEMLVAWAADLVKVDDIYYIYNYTPGLGTWVTTCTDIREGNWSDPVEICGVKGIDPGHVMDDEGNRYLCMSNNIFYSLAPDGLSVTGPGKKLCDYWPIPDDHDVEGIYTESPKFFKKNGYYYLLTAQGGTVGPPTSHCVVAYRAKHPAGPYELSPYNPIVHTKNRSHNWWSTGHGSLVDGPDGTTYILYHGIRNAHRYVGRQTLMMPVAWTEDGWFTVADNDDQPQKLPTILGAVSENKKSIPEITSQKLSVEPADGALGLLYNYDDKTVLSRIVFDDKKIRYVCEPGLPWKVKAISFMPQWYSYEYAVTLDWKHSDAGFAMGFYFTENMNCLLSINGNSLQLYKHGVHVGPADSCTIPEGKITLKMKCDDGTASFFYQISDENEIKIKHAYDIADWNPNVTNGFSYVHPSIWAFGEGEVDILSIRYKNL